MSTTSPATDYTCDITPFSSALDHMAKAIKEGQVTSRQLVDMYIDRIEPLDTVGGTNAIIQRDFEGPHRRADQADAQLWESRDSDSEHQLGAFHGVPITIKESHATPGFTVNGGDPHAWLPRGKTCTLHIQS